MLGVKPSSKRFKTSLKSEIRQPATSLWLIAAARV
jgi:hypothetical protein